MCVYMYRCRFKNPKKARSCIVNKLHTRTHTHTHIISITWGRSSRVDRRASLYSLDRSRSTDQCVIAVSRDRNLHEQNIASVFAVTYRFPSFNVQRSSTQPPTPSSQCLRRHSVDTLAMTVRSTSRWSIARVVLQITRDWCRYRTVGANMRATSASPEPVRIELYTHSAIRRSPLTASAHETDGWRRRRRRRRGDTRTGRHARTHARKRTTRKLTSTLSVVASAQFPRKPHIVASNAPN